MMNVGSYSYLRSPAGPCISSEIRDVGHPVQHPVHRDPGLRTRQRRTRAGVCAAPERHVLAHVPAVELELVSGSSNFRGSRLLPRAAA